ncbi:MAG: globin [bacterium]|nr:globin [bacterium]
MAWVEQEPWLQTNLEAMGNSHSEYGVEDRAYDWMVECMPDALEQVPGAKWCDEYEPAWCSTLGHLTDVMRAAGARQTRSQPR